MPPDIKRISHLFCFVYEYIALYYRNLAILKIFFTICGVLVLTF